MPFDKDQNYRLDFYMKGELLFSATPREFIDSGMFTRKGSSEEEIKEDDVYLGLGDRFTILDYPNKGDESLVRVMEQKTCSRQTDGNNRIEYTLDYYEEK
ncbi:hypothetical protein [Pseudalkalibacillus hwajinpoensis]|uniref:hypothetical protein n=1 Tax=Guptibacillus hwajinpoensis TaxID=208199 RepID=UPI00384A9F38